MEQKLIDTVILARKTGYTWKVIGEHLGMSDSLLRYYVRVNTKPQKPINEWWLENSPDPKPSIVKSSNPTTVEPQIDNPKPFIINCIISLKKF